MLCKLCNLNEANKDNTHYLTDAIIRSCLNLEGTNSRENGFYFDISNNTPFIDFSFQRNTSAAKLEQMMGRVPSDKEIEKAKKFHSLLTKCSAVIAKIFLLQLRINLLRKFYQCLE